MVSKRGNSDWTDAQIERFERARTNELYEDMTQKWMYTGAISRIDRLADTIEGLMARDRYDWRNLYNVLARSFSTKTTDFTIRYIPQTDTDRLRSINALGAYDRMINYIRNNVRFAFIVPINGVRIQDPEGGYNKSIIFDAHPLKKGRQQDQLYIDKWEKYHEKNINARQTTVKTVVENSKRTEVERQKLKRDEVNRRRKERRGEGEGSQ